MKLLFVINDFDSFVSTQTTAMLAQHAVELGHSVEITTIDGIVMSPDGGRIICRSGQSADDVRSFSDVVRSSEDHPLEADLFDVAFVRTNPGRGDRLEQHRVVLEMLDLLPLRVINAPSGLLRAFTKLYLERLPAWTRPESFISSDRVQLEAFVRQRCEPTVIKPLSGTRGRGVFIVHGNDLNLRASLEVLLESGPVIAQEVLEGASAGDVRLVVLDGEPLTIDDAVAAIRRVPAKGDFRSNIHAGGHAEPVEVSDAMRTAATAIGDILVADGIRLAGLDFIGDRVCEVNVFSTGGIRDAERFYQKPFAREIIRQLLEGAGSPS